MLGIEDALKRSDALIRTFSKRMATDKMIQMFFMLNFLAVIGIIVYAVLKDQGLGDDDAPADDATPGSDDAVATDATTTDATTTAATTARHLLRW